MNICVVPPALPDAHVKPGPKRCASVNRVISLDRITAAPELHRCVAGATPYKAHSTHATVHGSDVIPNCARPAPGIDEVFAFSTAHTRAGLSRPKVVTEMSLFRNLLTSPGRRRQKKHNLSIRATDSHCAAPSVVDAAVI